MTEWADHLYREGELGIGESPDLGDLFHRIIEDQSARWPMLGAGIAALAAAQRRRLFFPNSDFYVELLCNPLRYANVTTVHERAVSCPLCLDNLPPEEKGVQITPSLVALPNPAPIVADHIVLIHREHRRQSLTPYLAELMPHVIRSQGTVAVLYNGPSSGASAPFHAHFQAGRIDGLPLLKHVFALRSILTLESNGCTIRAVEFEGRRFIVLVADTPDLLNSALNTILDQGDHHPARDLNLLLWKHEAGLAVSIFLRAAHRPNCFYLPDPARLIISPGSMEMAGLIVVPRQTDWARVTTDDLRRIFSDVCIRDEEWTTLLDRLERRLGW